MSEFRSALPPRSASWRAPPRPRALAITVLAVAGTALLGMALHTMLPAGSLALLFLLAVLMVSVAFGFWTGIAASLLSFLAYNFLFVEPLYTLRVADAKDMLALAVFLAAAATTGFLAGRLREEADAARVHAAQTALAASFSSALAGCTRDSEVLALLVHHLSAIDGGRTVLLRAAESGIAVEIAAPDAPALDWADLQAAERALRRGQTEPAIAAGHGGSHYTFIPIGGAVLGHRAGAVGQRLDTRSVRDALLTQAASTLEQMRLAAAAQAAQQAAQREELRAALLASLSHDLRTPLATVLGGVTTLRELGERMTPQARNDLLGAVEEETRRLSDYVEKLLQLTRLQSGVNLRTEWCDPADIMQGAVARARRVWPKRAVQMTPPATLHLIRGDAVLLEQALFNLLDNALKFSPAGGEVTLAQTETASGVMFTVRDRGPGMQAPAPGGLGLAIVRGIAAAHGGTLHVESPSAGGRGTAAHLTIPLPMHTKPAA
jgi:two-component system sensor histidine kinase KdpD